MPMRVISGKSPGPVLFVCAGIHGDELNGTGIILEYMLRANLQLKRGTLIMAPVINIFGFETNQRYLPDRRDLNRSFPGSKEGSLAQRIANTVMNEIVHKSDYGIDLHSATAQRINYPNIRGDLSLPKVKSLAKAFGCELVVDGKGPVGSLRREACKSGCPTIILEAGEPWKIEANVLKIGCRGINNILAHLKMIDDPMIPPPYQAEIYQTIWVRAQVGGIMYIHVAPGDIVKKGDLIATNFSIMGAEQNIIRSPVEGVILGMTTMPTVKPGEPICHIAIPKQKIATIKRALKNQSTSKINPLKD